MLASVNGGGGGVRLERRLRGGLGLAAAATVAALLAAEAFVFGDLEGFPLDDSWIHLVFARSLAAGEGLAFQPGSTVAATTAPLWTALLALAALLPLPLPVAAKLAGALAHVASVDATYRLGRELGLAPWRAAFAGGLVLATDWLLWSSTAGMEVPLFVWLSLEGIRRHLVERQAEGAGRAAPPVSFLLIALAALARPEGLLLLPLALADRWLRFQREGGALVVGRPRLAPPLLGLGVAALVLAPVALAFFDASGSALPTTLAAKSSGPPRLLPELRFLRAVLGILFVSQPWVTLAAAGGGIELARRLGGARDRGLLLPAWALGMPVASAMLSSGREILVGNFGRYFFPILPALALLAVLALEPISFARFRTLRLGRGRLPLGAVAALALWLLPAARLPGAVGLSLQARANIDDGDVALARWVAARVPPTATLAVCDIGAMRWINPHRIVDLAGIATPETRRYLVAAERERELPWPPALYEWIERQRPDYVVLFPHWFPLLEREPERFPPVHRRKISGNVALAGDELVVYATPWTRYPLLPEPPAPSEPSDTSEPSQP